MPSCASAGRALAHALELCRNLLQSAVGRRDLDPGNEAGQPVIAALLTGAPPQCRLDDAVRRQALDRAAQAFDRPGRVLTALIEDTDDIAPRLVWAHPTHGRQPGIQLGQHVIEMGRVTAGAQFADRLRITGAQPGVAADPAPRLGRAKAGLGALGDQGTLQLGYRAQHLQGEHALRRAGIDRVVQAAEMRTGGFELLNDSEQMADRPGQSVEPDHDQSFVGTDFTKQPRQHGPAAVGAGGMLFENARASCRAQFVELWVGPLVLGRDPRIPNRLAADGRCCALQ